MAEPTLFCACKGTGRVSALCVTMSSVAGIRPGDLVDIHSLGEIDLDPRIAHRLIGVIVHAPCTCSARMVEPADLGKWLWHADWRKEPDGRDSMGVPAFKRRLAIYGAKIGEAA